MRVLFVCTGNTCRSPMAEAITRALAKARELDLDVASAGVRAETTITAPTVQVLRARGIDSDGRVAVQLTPEVLDGADLVLGMTAEHVAAVAAMGGRAHRFTDFVGQDGDIADPAGQPIEVYEATAARMDTLSDALLNKISSD